MSGEARGVSFLGDAAGGLAPSALGTALGAFGGALRTAAPVPSVAAEGNGEPVGMTLVFFLAPSPPPRPPALARERGER